MKEDVKMKENMNAEPMGTMPHVGAMHQMQAAPNVLPVQPNLMGTMPSMMSNMGTMPSMMSNMGTMPSMMNSMPVMCCPYLMNMQCPMTYGHNVMGMNMMNSPMHPGASPISGNMNPMLGAANYGMNPMPGMGMMPAMNQYYPMGGL